MIEKNHKNQINHPKIIVQTIKNYELKLKRCLNHDFYKIIKRLFKFQ